MTKHNAETRKCGHPKTPENSIKCGFNRSGAQHYRCKECATKSSRDRYHANPAKDRERNRQWRRENPELARESGRKSTLKWMRENPERYRALKANRLARSLGLPATLTQEQWQEVLERYDHKCVYCGADFECIDHFIPLARGGGTTKANCVPSCSHCNHVKLANLWD